jgi:hypothetical protein
MAPPPEQLGDDVVLELGRVACVAITLESAGYLVCHIMPTDDHHDTVTVRQSDRSPTC